MRQFIVLAFSLFLIGCGNPSSSPKVGPGGPPGGKPKVAFVTNNPDPFWSIVEAGCNKAANEVGVEVVFRKPASGDPAVQQEVLDGLVNRDIKAIAVSVSEPKNQTAHLDELATKLPLIAVDNDAPESKRLCYIGTNNYEAGRAVGALVKEAMPDGGTVALFVGLTGSLNAHQRCQGVLDELADTKPPADTTVLPQLPTGSAQFGKYKLLKIFTDQPEGQTKATQNASDALIQLKDEANVCLVGLWAYNPPAILTAVSDAGKLGKVKIVGFDENPNTLNGIKEGHIYATCVQDPFGFGYESVLVMSVLAKGEPYRGPKLRGVPHRIITKDGGKDRISVAEFEADLNKKLGKGK